MGTTIHEPPQIDPDRLLKPRHSGNGGWRDLVPANGDLHLALDHSPPASSSAIYVVLFAITMMFAAFSSALIVRKGSSLDWQTFTLPSILYLNTLILVASSVTLEVARPGALSSHEPQQFFLLCAYGYSCAARPGRSGRADLCHSQTG